jgi:hypothetical protein
MSAEETEPPETTGAEGAGFDDGVAEGVEEGVGCVVETEAGFPASFAAGDKGPSVLPEGVGTTEEEEEGGPQV